MNETPISSQDMNTPIYQSGYQRFMDYLHTFFENQSTRDKMNDAKDNKEVIDVIREATDFIPRNSK